MQKYGVALLKGIRAIIHRVTPFENHFLEVFLGFDDRPRHNSGDKPTLMAGLINVCFIKVLSALSLYFMRFFRQMTYAPLGIVLALSSSISGAYAAPYAAIVQDARTGEVLHSRNANTRLHPASLTKMLTLYIAFQEVESGRIRLDDKVTVSKYAAATASTGLNLKRGQKITYRHLIRATAIKSANDAATALGEAISGSEKKFSARMNRTAKALGMKHSTFKNAHGLTASGHLSTAHDMNLLGLRLFYDFPEYYNIFSRSKGYVGLKRPVKNTNRKFLKAYKYADGIKTGYTSKAGYNLTSSAEKNGVRIIATVFGTSSVAARNKKMAKLLDLGFQKAPRRVNERRLAFVGFGGNALVLTATPRPLPRAEGLGVRGEKADEAKASEGLVVEVAQRSATLGVAIDLALSSVVPAAHAATIAPSHAPPPRPSSVQQSDQIVRASFVTRAEELPRLMAPPPQRAPIFTQSHLRASTAAVAQGSTRNIIVLKASDDGASKWAIALGKFATQSAAQEMILNTKIGHSTILESGVASIDKARGGFDARIGALNKWQAEAACRNLQALDQPCQILEPYKS